MASTQGGLGRDACGVRLYSLRSPNPQAVSAPCGSRSSRGRDAPLAPMTTGVVGRPVAWPAVCRKRSRRVSAPEARSGGPLFYPVRNVPSLLASRDNREHASGEADRGTDAPHLPPVRNDARAAVLLSRCGPSGVSGRPAQTRSPKYPWRSSVPVLRNIRPFDIELVGLSDHGLRIADPGDRVQRHI